MSNQAEIWAIIPAAGVGKRMQSTIPKQYLPLCGSTVLDITITKILTAFPVKGVVIAVSDSDDRWPESRYANHKVVHVCKGGGERRDSVLNALLYIQTLNLASTTHTWALVHDAARPCVAVDNIQKLIESSLTSRQGGILAVPAADTLKKVDKSGRIVRTEDRSKIWQAHTPQLFQYSQLRSALEYCTTNNLTVTDEASAIEQRGGAVCVVNDRRDNIKITLPEDLPWAEYILKKQAFSMSKL